MPAGHGSATSQGVRHVREAASHVCPLGQVDVQGVTHVRDCGSQMRPSLHSTVALQNGAQRFPSHHSPGAQSAVETPATGGPASGGGGRPASSRPGAPCPNESASAVVCAGNTSVLGTSSAVYESRVARTS